MGRDMRREKGRGRERKGGEGKGGEKDPHECGLTAVLFPTGFRFPFIRFPFIPFLFFRFSFVHFHSILEPLLVTRCTYIMT